ncbi:hypothetical protein [Nocardia miyunensis]|uniref:hypothetical protein n=1 Tax=Nocardia miyunensis TaxID=282684 RepID=UPI000A7682CC|nr:hypothetical protein [Nocardia miyunensis]
MSLASAIALQSAADAFGRSIQHCHNLIAIHEERNNAQGRRHREISLNRATIVLAVATWQTLVQDLTMGALEAAKPDAAAALAEAGTYRLIRAQIERQVRNFSTPNTQNTRDLLDTVGLDVKPHWIWEVGAQGRDQRRTRKFEEIKNELEDWLQVRHAIAHGHKNIPRRLSLDAIHTRYASEQKRGVTNPAYKSYPPPEIRKADAYRCTRFFFDLGETTTSAMVDVLGCTAPRWPDWPAA